MGGRLIVVALLFGIILAQELGQQPITFSRHPGLTAALQSTAADRGDVQVKYYTFDSVYTGKDGNVSLHSHDLLELDNWRTVDVNAAHERGFLDSRDMDCAASYPNALYNGFLGSPSAIRVNTTALAIAKLSPFFDVIGFTWKARGMVKPGTTLTMSLWRLANGVPILVDGVSMSSFAEEAYNHPVTLKPSEWWPDWGKGVNFVEISAQTGDGKPSPMCVDSLVLVFYAAGS